MRTVTLDKESFAVLYQSILAGDFKGGEARLAGRTLGKLEEQARFDDNTKLFGLQDGPVTVSFEEAEWAMLLRQAELTPWRGVFVRKAAQIMDWMAGVKEDEKHVATTPK